MLNSSNSLKKSYFCDMKIEFVKSENNKLFVKKFELLSENNSNKKTKENQTKSYFGYIDLKFMVENKKNGKV